MTTKLKRWKRHYAKIAEQVVFLDYYSAIRDQFYIIVNHSEIGNIKNEFWDLSHRAFANEMIVRICRIWDPYGYNKVTGHIDKKKEVYSLLNLMREFERYPGLLSRKNFLGVKQVSAMGFLKSRNNGGKARTIDEYNRLNRLFDNIAGKGAEHVPSITISKDIEYIDSRVERIKAYRNKYLSHNSVKKGRFKPPRMSEISRTIDALTAVMNKYYFVLSCSNLSSSFNTPDLTPLFSKNWIETDRVLKKIKDESERRRQSRKEKQRAF